MELHCSRANSFLEASLNPMRLTSILPASPNISKLDSTILERFLTMRGLIITDWGTSLLGFIFWEICDVCRIYLQTIC